MFLDHLRKPLMETIAEIYHQPYTPNFKISICKSVLDFFKETTIKRDDKFINMKNLCPEKNSLIDLCYSVCLDSIVLFRNYV